MMLGTVDRSAPASSSTPVTEAASGPTSTVAGSGGAMANSPAGAVSTAVNDSVSGMGKDAGGCSGTTDGLSGTGVPIGKRRVSKSSAFGRVGSSIGAACWVGSTWPLSSMGRIITASAIKTQAPTRRCFKALSMGALLKVRLRV